VRGLTYREHLLLTFFKDGFRSHRGLHW
jgi:hypothetical protein